MHTRFQEIRQHHAHHLGVNGDYIRMSEAAMQLYLPRCGWSAYCHCQSAIANPLTTCFSGATGKLSWLGVIIHTFDDASMK
jgi:hypothetical protein